MPTHFFHSGMAGAPTNTNAAGSTLAIIDATLVTGFNLQSVLSATVASEVMTVNYAIPHGYEDKVLIRLDGAAGGSIVRRATVTGAQVLTIPAPGFADGAVAGTLSTRVAPADWERVFSDTGKAVFRSKVEGPGSTRFFYRVADAAVSGSLSVGFRAFRGYESMSDASTGVGLFPTAAQETGNGLTVFRSSDATAKPWCVVADARTAYIFLTHDLANASFNAFGFGDFKNYSSADMFNAFAVGGAWGSETFARASGGPVIYSPRSYQNTGTSITLGKAALLPVSGANSYPVAIDGGEILSRPVLVTQSSMPRGEFRGLAYCSHNAVPSGSLFTVRSTVEGVSGRVLIVKDSLASSACVAFPIDEDWL